MPAPPDVYVTRLHAQYSKTQLPKDPVFRETANRENFQGRYVMNHPFQGEMNCEWGRDYMRETRKRIRSEAGVLAGLTGWSRPDIQANIRKTVPEIFW